MKKIFLYVLWLGFSCQAQTQLTNGEWFIDTDPGIGNGTAISFAQGNTTNTTFGANIASLTPGFHNLFIRVKNADNVWSHYEGRTFYIIPTTASVQPNLVSGEWFIDTDPGLGNGTAISFTAAGLINESITITPNSLSDGIHHLFIRVKDANNVWSHYEGRQFTKTVLGVENYVIKKFNMFPNPTNAILNFQTDNKIESIRIVDVTGKISNFTRLSLNRIDVSSISTGVYFVEIKTEEGFFREKFIKN